MSTREIPVSINGPCESLEALYLDLPDARGIALICHPHPLSAGTMQNKVVATLQRNARNAGLATPRFNFRGVGRSAGSYGEGIGEIDDAETATCRLMARHPEPPLTLMGFSFGSYVAGNPTDRLEAEGVELARLFTIAPPVGRFAAGLPACCPLTVVQPKDDDVVVSAAIYAWSESLARLHELLQVVGSGHSSHGKLIDLRDSLPPCLQDWCCRAGPVTTRHVILFFA